MGCGDSPDTSDDFIKIEKGYNSLIKSVQMEMDGYQKQIEQFKFDKNKLKDINYEYNQKILKIFHEKNSYQYLWCRDDFLKRNLLNDAQQCLKNEEIVSKLKPGLIIEINAIEKERNDKLEKLKLLLNEENVNAYNDLNEKIELCKNQIKIYEKEKQAAIIAKREEIRNNLLKSNIQNGVFSMYQDRQGYNQNVDNIIVNRIHNDFRNPQINPNE